MTLAPGSWVEWASCRALERDMSIPELARGTSPKEWRAHVAGVKTICAGCAVESECLEWALMPGDPAAGMVAGGMTPKERTKLKKERAA